MQALKLYLWGTTTVTMPCHIRTDNACSERKYLEVNLTITNPITSNNFCNSLADLRVGHSHLQGGTLYASSIITSIMQYWKTASFAPSVQFFLSSFPLARSASSWQRMFFIYFRVVSHEFVSTSLRKPCVFSHGF